MTALQLTPTQSLDSFVISRFEDCAQLVMEIRKKKPILAVYSIEDSDQLRRAIDFIEGAICALEGESIRVANNRYIYGGVNGSAV
jgi:FtsZ-interacting cell division protein YlmF